MNKHEAKQHTKVAAWIRWYIEHSGRNVKVEIKHTRGTDSFPYSEVPQHQLDDLESFERFPFVHKFDDVGFRRKPCDSIGVAPGDSFVAIRYPGFIAIIEFKRYALEAKGSLRRSLESDRARKIAHSTIEI